MRWEEIDEDWFWNAPQSDKDNKRLHSIPLPALAQRILHPRKETGFVFPGSDDGHIYVQGMWLQTKIIRASGMTDYFHHGMRHLAETKTAELKIPATTRDLLFDHVPQRGSGAGYDHHHYKDEMRAAAGVVGGLHRAAGYSRRRGPVAGLRLLLGCARPW